MIYFKREPSVKTLVISSAPLHSLSSPAYSPPSPPRNSFHININVVDIKSTISNGKQQQTSSEEQHTGLLLLNEIATTFVNNKPDPIATIITLPPEIFIIICSNLAAGDLFRLSKVCRLFNSYLCTTESTSTQQIWRAARLQIWSWAEHPAPDIVDEKSFLEMLLERRCEWCGELHAYQYDRRKKLL
ncbi:1391_t:CDS:2 [Ambispora gerdemannii]|uniref:1391_t:CDS:1 n=1 Tax=Ambispora gerdemannii TaxID=144530 RepID=A0A9N9A3R2_9GLOM|nr:1391_t:CDS:2 [Ambispora gerdemannii]